MASDTDETERVLASSLNLETTVATLSTREPSSLLARLFRVPGSLKRTSQGAVLLEADPDAFEHILAWLRKGAVPQRLTPLRERVELQAKQFELTGLLEALTSAQAMEPLSSDTLYTLLNRAPSPNGQPLPPMSLPGANLFGLNLSGVDLKNANLRGANLRRANLSNAVLNGANLEMADLSEAV